MIETMFAGDQPQTIPTKHMSFSHKSRCYDIGGHPRHPLASLTASMLIEVTKTATTVFTGSFLAHFFEENTMNPLCTL